MILGAGHSSAGETLCGRVVAALKTEALLNETIGVGYLGRQWPPAFKESGAWPLTSLRQSFLDGSLTRLRDPDTTLREKIVEFVRNGSFGLGSGPNDSSGYERLWYAEEMPSEEVAFDEAVFPREEGEGRSTSRTTRRRHAAGTGAGPDPGTRPAARWRTGADASWRRPVNHERARLEGPYHRRAGTDSGRKSSRSSAPGPI